MKAYCKWMEGLPRIVKIIFCLPILDILWGLYRIFSVFTNFNVLRLILAILWFIFGGFILWILDLIFIIVFDHICWFKS